MTDGGTERGGTLESFDRTYPPGSLTELTRTDPEKAMNIHPYLTSSRLCLSGCGKTGTGGAPHNDPLTAIAVERGRPSQ